MKGPLRAGALIAGALGLVVTVLGATGDGDTDSWVTALIALVILACGAVVAAVVIRTPEPMTRIRRVTVAWIALTIVTAPFAYGAPLFVTVPGLAALAARLYVGPSEVPGRTITCLLVGPAVLTGGLWFILRVDEAPGEAIPAGLLVASGLVGVRQLRRQSRTTAAAST